MRVFIDQTMIRHLKAEALDLRDTKLTGFLIRCRPSGQHSYLFQLGRGQYHTIGRVAKMSVAAARRAAETLRGNLNQQALAERLEDEALTLAQARHKARVKVQTRRRQRRTISTWAAFLTDTYEPWILANQKTGAESVARLKTAFATFNARPLTELQAFAVERWRAARLRSGVTKATVNRDLAAFRGALTKACEWKLLAQHPLADVKAFASDPIGHVRFLSGDENARLRAALAARDDRRRVARETANRWRRERGYTEWPALGHYTDHLTPLVLLAINTGLRRGELFNVRGRDLDLIGARLTVAGDGTKTGKTRVVPLNREAVAVLRAWTSDQVVGPDAYVFPGADGGRLEDLKTAFLKVLRDAQITTFRFHDLRHDFASKLVMAGVDLNTVRELLGHADIKMTLRYAHLAPEHKAAAVATLVRA
jgi:integrase